MNTFNSWKGSLVKGSRLKSLGLRFVKITNPIMIHHELQLCIGKNVDKYPLSTIACSRGGIYFCPIDAIGLFLEYGNGYHYVDFADDEDIFIEENKCKARTIVLSEKINYKFMKKELFEIAAKMNNYAIKYISQEVNNYYEICKIAVAYNGLSIRHMSYEMKNNEEICKIAAAQNGYSIQYMNIAMKFNSKICEIAAAQNGYSIKSMVPEMRNDPKICKIAVSQNGMVLYYMSNSIKNNLEICKAAMMNNEKAYRYIGESIKQLGMRHLKHLAIE